MNPQIIAALIGAGGSVFAGLATAAVAATAIWATGRSTDKAIAAQRTVAEEQRLWERQAEVYLEALAWMGKQRFQEAAILPPDGFDERITAFCPHKIREPLLVMTATMRQLKSAQERAVVGRSQGTLIATLVELQSKVEARIRGSLQGGDASQNVHMIGVAGQTGGGEPAVLGVGPDGEGGGSVLDYARSLDSGAVGEER